jgi:hypothetical protein
MARKSLHYRVGFGVNKIGTKSCSEVRLALVALKMHDCIGRFASAGLIFSNPIFHDQCEATVNPTEYRSTDLPKNLYPVCSWIRQLIL